MRRQTIETVRRLCREVYTLCDVALDACNLEAEASASRRGEDFYPRPMDKGYGKDTATLRRRSMDLTRALADLRRPS